jgi:phosphoglycerate dehydrogenase-like enzyme
MHRARPPTRRSLWRSTFAATCMLNLALQVTAAAPAPTHSKPTQPQIAVLGAAGCIDDAHLQTLRTLGSVAVLDRRSFNEGEAIEMLRGVTIAIANPYVLPLTQPVLENADSLKLVVLPITGFDRIDLDTASRKGIKVVNSPDYSLEAVAEDAVALMLAVSRHIPEADAAVRQGQLMTPPPENKLVGFELSGKTLGVVGLGRIGARVAEIARGFGMKTIAWDRNPKNVEGVTQVPLEELLAQSDVISLHLALTKDTAGILTAARLRLMKPTAVLINTARAELVDEPALYSALQEGRLAAAGLDVVSSAEPSNPLLKLNNVVLSPHLGFHSRESRTRCADSVVQAVQAYVAGSDSAPVKQSR